MRPAGGVSCLSARKKSSGERHSQKGAKPIAIYRCSIKIISRGKGKSAVAAAAYRSGETIKNEYDGVTHDYTRKGGIVHTEILLPDNAPAEYSDRAVLWNAVGKSERYKTAQLAREIEIALPVELTREQNISLVREYVNRHFVAAGMCADFAIHDKQDGNPHAHIMLTMRPIEKDGKWGQKLRTENGIKIPTVDWNEQTKAEIWRGAWADMCNQYLECGNHTERIDHRSYERQGIDQIPTVHLGVAAFQMEKRGIATERGNLNRQIEVTNSNLRQLKARLVKLQKWLKEEAANTEPPTLAHYIQEILSRKTQAGKSQYSQSLYNLKDAANMLNFLTRNKIMDMAGLDDCFGGMISRQQSISNKLKPIDRRLKTLDEYIKQADNHLKYKPFNDTYKQQKPKKQNVYYENFRMEITLFESAQKYLAGVLNGRTTLPLKSWKAERDKLTAERNRLNGEYVSLKDEVKEAEQIRRSVYSILRQEQRERQPRRAQDLEL